MNIVVRPKVYERYRWVARMEPLLVVEGIAQKSRGTVNILAERLIPLRHEAERQRSISVTIQPQRTPRAGIQALAFH